MNKPLPDSKDISIEDVAKHLNVALLCDALDQVGLRCQAPSTPLGAMTSSRPLVGYCRTSLWVDVAHEDPQPYELEFEAVDSCEPGEVLIAAASGSMRAGIWGELLSTAARNRGCVGAIVDGAVRDIIQMKSMDFVVYAKGPSPLDSLNRLLCIDVNVPVEIGGVLFSPGDLVFADADGVVVVPKQVEREVVSRAWAKVHTENLARQDLHVGMKASDVYAKHGVL